MILVKLLRRRFWSTRDLPKPRSLPLRLFPLDRPSWERIYGQLRKFCNMSMSSSLETSLCQCTASAKSAETIEPISNAIGTTIRFGVRQISRLPCVQSILQLLLAFPRISKCKINRTGFHDLRRMVGTSFRITQLDEMLHVDQPRSIGICIHEHRTRGHQVLIFKLRGKVHRP